MLKRSYAAVALLGFSGVASALTNQDWQNAGSQEAYTRAGTSAVVGMTTEVSLAGCNTSAGNTANVYYSGATIADSDNVIVYCTSNGVLTGNGVALAISERAGGSAEAIYALARPATVTLPLYDPATFGASCDTGAPRSSNANIIEHANCTDATPNMEVNVGVTDVESARFRSVGAASGFGSNLSFTEAQSLEDIAGPAVVYGVQANLRLYRILQAGQFPSTHKCHPNNDDYDNAVTADEVTGNAPTDAYTVGDSVECRPSLSTQQVRSILADSFIFAWDDSAGPGGYYGRDGEFINCGTDPVTGTTQVRVSDGNGNIVNGNVSYLDGQQGAYVCAENSASGSQAQAEIHWHRMRCSQDNLNDATFSTQTFESDGCTEDAQTVADYFGSDNDTADNCARGTGTDSFRSNRTHFASSSSRVRGCLDAHEFGRTCALAINSTSNKRCGASSDGVSETLLGGTVADRNKFRFIKVDGNMPSLLNVATGKYEDAFVQSIVVNTNANSEVKAFANAFAAAYNDPANVAAINSQFQQCGYDGGLVAYATFSNGLSLGQLPEDSIVGPGNSAAVHVRNNPITTWSRSYTATGAVNNCLPPLQIDSQLHGVESDN